MSEAVKLLNPTVKYFLLNHKKVKHKKYWYSNCFLAVIFIIFGLVSFNILNKIFKINDKTRSLWFYYNLII